MKTKSESHFVPRLTVETALWGLLLILSLGLRLWRLDAAPLNASEARGSLAAWRFAYGQGAPTSTGYSPALFSGQWFIFLIFSANDLSARLLPALAGTVLALAPALLRRQLGRLGALLAGLLLALSPTALTLSRTASGGVLVALGALLCAGGLWRWADVVPPHDEASFVHRPSSTVYWLSLGIALMLASSPLAYSALLSLGVPLLLILTARETRIQFQEGWAALCATPDLARYASGTLAGGFVLFSTTFAWNIGGLAAAAHLLTEWLGGFVRWPDSLSAGYPLLILFVYEPLILLTGGAGALLSVRRNSTTTRFMTLWGVVALALALIRPGHDPGDVLLILLPLACLGGLALDALVAAWRPLKENLERWGQSAWLNAGVFLAISMLLWAHLIISLANYARRPGQYTDLNLLFFHFSWPTFLSLALVSAVLLLMLMIVASVAQGPGPTLYALGLSTMLALLSFTVAAAWGVSQNRPADPREPLVIEPTATEVRLLTDTLVHLSNEHRGDAHAIDMTVLNDDPALAWALRDFRQAHLTEATRGPFSTAVIITRQASLELAAGLGTPEFGPGGYVGQSFTLRRRWKPGGLACRRHLTQAPSGQARQLDCSSLVRWLIFRHSPTEPTEERVVLWLRQDLARAR